MRLQLIAVALIAGCGGAVTFQGHGHFDVTGSPIAKADPPRVEVKETKLEIRDKIQFEYSKAVISRASYDLMDEIADVIKHNPQIKKIQIEGHASADGSARYNRTLSAGRANAVKKYLVDHGVPADELTAVGFGSEKPVGDNTTAEGREQNRRVEFTIIDDDNTDSTASTGKRGAP
jgi:outer membrane protein OmpA-like peptidoglycan-associated protein